LSTTSKTLLVNVLFGLLLIAADDKNGETQVVFMQ